MTRSRYGGHRGGTKRRGKAGNRPISIGAVERTPVRRRLESRGQYYFRPNRPQRDEERPIHQTFQVSGEPHPRIREFLFDEADYEPEQDQQDAVPKELAFFIRHFHLSWVFSDRCNISIGGRSPDNLLSI